VAPFSSSGAEFGSKILQVINGSVEKMGKENGGKKGLGVHREYE